MPGRMPGIDSGEKNQIRKLQLRTKIGTGPVRGGACATGFSILTEEMGREDNSAKLTAIASELIVKEWNAGSDFF